MKRKHRFILILLGILFLGFLLPQHLSMPVKGADQHSYHAQSFWYYPWGKSGTHKGVDIFAKAGTSVQSATAGIVLYEGNVSMGGNVVVILGPKWRLHYYAHLQSIQTSFFSFIHAQEEIGKVGDTGNAKGKPPHLHYSLLSLIPYVWRIDSDKQGWKKMFYLNPVPYLQGE